MFKVVMDYSEFKHALVRHMSLNSYEMPDDTDDIAYDSDGTLSTFPILVSFINITHGHIVRSVYAKACKKSIAKAIIYPKTNKLPINNQGGWVVNNSTGEYSNWINDLLHDMDVDHGIRSSHVELAPFVHDNKPFLSSYTLYLKPNNDDPWLKTFTITHAEAKELVYCNKKPEVVITGGGGFYSFTEAFTINTDVTNFVILSDSDVEETATTEEPNQCGVATELFGIGTLGDGVQLFGDTESEAPDHSSLSGLADGDSPQYVIEEVQVDGAAHQHVVEEAITPGAVCMLDTDDENEEVQIVDPVVHAIKKRWNRYTLSYEEVVEEEVQEVPGPHYYAQTQVAEGVQNVLLGVEQATDSNTEDEEESDDIIF
jgi:hypothetical protein